MPAGNNMILKKISLTRSCSLGIIHLVSTQNLPKKQHLLPPDTHKYEMLIFREILHTYTSWQNN